MQEHDVKLAVRKTEVRTDNFFYQLQKKAANHSTALVQGAQVSETFRAHFLAIPPKTPATISEPEALPVDGPVMPLSADSECCVLALVKCKETIQTNKPTSPKTKKPKTPIPLLQNQRCCSCESYLNQHTLAISVRVFCDRSHSKNPSINGSVTDVRKVLNSVLHQKVWNRKKALKL